MSGLQIMKNVSHRHKLHLLDILLYDFAHLRILHLIEYSIPLCFRSQMCLLSSVQFCFRMLRNDVLLLAYRNLNLFSVSPTYVSGGRLSDVVTVAWYTIDSVRQFLRIGHSVGFRQLQLFT